MTSPCQGDPAGTTDKEETPESPTSIFPDLDHSVMHRNGRKLHPDRNDVSSSFVKVSDPPAPLQWHWETEHTDRQHERKADAALHGATPFEVDRRVLKDVVREKMGIEVGRITFLSAGVSGFHFTGIDIILTLGGHRNFS